MVVDEPTIKDYFYPDFNVGKIYIRTQIEGNDMKEKKEEAATPDLVWKLLIQKYLNISSKFLNLTC